MSGWVCLCGFMVWLYGCRYMGVWVCVGDGLMRRVFLGVCACGGLTSNRSLHPTTPYTPQKQLRLMQKLMGFSGFDTTKATKYI